MELKFSLLSVCLVLFFVLALSLIAERIHRGDNGNMYYICMLYDIVCCLFVLYQQVDYKKKLTKQRETDIQEQLWIKQKELHELRKNDMETINLICHDIKKHLESLKLFSTEEERLIYYSQVSETIQSYDSQLRTGSEVLDVLLSQKNLFCKQNDINLTCVVDGKKTEFINVVDLYTIFGNAIDNAIESVLAVMDPEKRMISVSVWAKANLLLIQIENYLKNKELIFEDGLPLTTKQESKWHGYGLKSIRHTVEKYDGEMNISAENNLFRLAVFIPLPEAMQIKK